MRIVILFMLTFLFACSRENPVVVEVEKHGDRFGLLKNGESFFINGFYTSEGQLPHKVCYAGGNTIMLTDVKKGNRILNYAYEKGLYVILPLSFIPGEEGLKEITKYVKRHKNHPALLCWALMPQRQTDQPEASLSHAYCNSLNQTIRILRELDIHHPFILELDENEWKAMYNLTHITPEADILGIGHINDMQTCTDFFEGLPWNKPWVFMKWSPGYDHTTSWGLQVEPGSSEKADFFRLSYKKIIKNAYFPCLGALAQYEDIQCNSAWQKMGDKLKDTEVLHILHYLWKGEWPQNIAPRILSLKINGKQIHDHPVFKPGYSSEAHVTATDPDGDELQFVWELVQLKGHNDGHLIWEKKGANAGNLVHFQLPETGGAFKLSVFVYDSEGNFASAYLPFFIESDAQLLSLQDD